MRSPKSKLASLLPWRWQFWHDPHWQKSSVQSAAFWLLGTLIIFKTVNRLGHGVVMSVCVSLGMDLAAYGINKLWIWKKRNTPMHWSLRRNFTAWAMMAVVNLLLTWQAIDHLGTHNGRYLLGGYGILINPVVFKVRDKLVFAEYDIRETAAALCRMEMSKALAASRMMLMRNTGI